MGNYSFAHDMLKKHKDKLNGSFTKANPKERQSIDQEVKQTEIFSIHNLRKDAHLKLQKDIDNLYDMLDEDDDSF